MSTEAGEGIEEHGVTIDKDKDRVECNFCGKNVRGFHRLKQHLGGVGHDVTTCMNAPDALRARMRDSLLEKKKERLLKEIGELYHLNLPSRRNFSPPLIDPKRPQPKLTPSLHAFHVRRTISDMRYGESDNHAVSTQPNTSWKEMNVMDHDSHEDGNADDTNPFFCQKEGEHVIVKEEVKDVSELNAGKHIGRFFFEAGIDLTASKLTSFQRMVDAVISCGPVFKVPRYDELNGWILQEQLKEVHKRIEDVRSYWGRTGCSILLDGWTDQMGRRLLRFLVCSPFGTIFLRSMNASDVVSDVNALFLLLSRVVEEVGVQNVVQVVAHEWSFYMEAAGKRLVEKYRSVCWTLCADYCINLILERIGMLDHVKKVLHDARNITRFIYSHSLPFELMKKHIQGSKLVRTLNLKLIADFMTLENMFCERERLIHMFRSPTWCFSVLSSKAKGKKICELVNDPLFWDAVAGIIKVTNPLIGVLYQIDGGDTTPMGILYDAMDRAKEAIKSNLQGEVAGYQPIWTIIDEIWDNYLHSPLHSAGYYLNPNLFCSNDFFVDAEITNGLLGCIVRMIEDQKAQAMIVPQLEAYTTASGVFADDMAIDQRSKIPPALWWASHGGRSLELQRFAIKIFSQPCSGASRFKLKKDVSELVHHKGRSCSEQQMLCDIEFVQNNLRLWNTPFSWNQDCSAPENSHLVSDWIAEV